MQAMNDAMNMSLDEYIALNKKKIKNTDKDARNGNSGAFKTRSRSDNNADKGGETNCNDITMKDLTENQKSKNAEKIWKGPSSHTDFIEFNYMFNDFNTVYKEIVEENGSQDLPPANSIQWRIDPVNVNRPAGMAPLIPRNIPKKQRISNDSNIINRQKFKIRNTANRNRNRNYQSQRNTNFNRQENKNFNLNTRFSNNNTSRNSIQMNTVSKLCQNFRNKEEATPSINNNAFHSVALNNNFNPETNAFAFNADNSFSHPKPNQDSLIRPPNQVDGNLGKLSLASIFNVDNNTVAQRNLGSMAGKFLDFLSNYENTVHKPVYDMDIQQEIAKLQNKNLVCTNTGTIVSKDGTGVPDCKIVPKTTAMSLNIRYC